MAEDGGITNGVPAGWHSDPYGGVGLRYWDGQQWTEHQAPGRAQTGADPSVVGAKPVMSRGKKAGLIAGVMVVGVIVVGALLGPSAKEPTTIAAGGSTSTTVAFSPATTVATTEAPTTLPPPTFPPTTVAPTTVPPTTAPTKTAPPTIADPYANETVSQRNARKKAQSYFAVSAFSRKGLIEQLEYSGFPTADATYGTDAQKADWNEQAAKKAKSYMEVSAFSRESLIEQLEYSGFTRLQAEFGAKAVGF